MKEYPILCGRQKIGTARTERQGLYYRLECRCHRQQETPPRIQVYGPSGTAKLGICVPMDGDFGLTARIPIKQIGEEPLSFSVTEPKQKPSEKFVPIIPGQAMDCLSRLRYAHLEEKDGQLGLCITDRSQAPQGSDPSP